MAEKLSDKYKRAFFSGLATLLPTILTIFVITFCYNFIKDKIADPLSGFFRAQLATEFAKEYYWKALWGYESGELTGDAFAHKVAQHVPGWLGFALALVLVFVVGFLFKGFLGRQILRALERSARRIPVVKVIYPYAKQITEFFF